MAVVESVKAASEVYAPVTGEVIEVIEAVEPERAEQHQPQGDQLADVAEDVVADAHGSVALGFFDRTTIYALTPQDQAPPSVASWRCETGKEWTGTRLRFVLTPAGWRMSAMAWDDERPGLRLPRHAEPTEFGSALQPSEPPPEGG